MYARAQIRSAGFGHGGGDDGDDDGDDHNAGAFHAHEKSAALGSASERATSARVPL